MSLTRSLTSPVPSRLSSALNSPSAGGGFAPLNLPSLVAWYDPSDLSTMFQDTAGTVPVTAAGQSVARINDKSGNGNNATQATGTAQPLLQQDGSGNYYLDFDGADDFMTFTVASSSATVAMFVGGFVDAIGADRCAVGNIDTSAFNGSQLEVASGGAERFRSGNGASLVSNSTGVPLSGATPFVIAGRYSPTSQISRRNGIDSTTTTVTVAAGSTTFAIGRRSAAAAAEYWNGGIYGLAVCQAAVTQAHLEGMDRYLGGKSGVFF